MSSGDMIINVHPGDSDLHKWDVIASSGPNTAFGNLVLACHPLCLGHTKLQLDVFAICVAGMMVAVVSGCIVIHYRSSYHSTMANVGLTACFVGAFIAAFVGILCKVRLALVPWLIMLFVAIVAGAVVILVQTYRGHVLHSAFCVLVEVIIAVSCYKTLFLFIHWKRENLKSRGLWEDISVMRTTPTPPPSTALLSLTKPQPEERLV